METKPISKQSTKDILESLDRLDCMILREVINNEKVFFILKKWVATPNKGWNSRQLLDKIVVERMDNCE